MINFDAKTAKEKTIKTLAINDDIINDIYNNNIIPAINNGDFETNITLINVFYNECCKIINYFKIKGFKISEINHENLNDFTGEDIDIELSTFHNFKISWE